MVSANQRDTGSSLHIAAKLSARRASSASSSADGGSKMRWSSKDALRVKVQTERTRDNSVKAAAEA